MFGFYPFSTQPFSTLPLPVTAVTGGAPNYQYPGEYEIEQPGTISDFLRTENAAGARRRRLDTLRRELGLIQPDEPTPEIEAEPLLEPEVVEVLTRQAVVARAPEPGTALPEELYRQIAADVAARLGAELAAEIEAERLEAIAQEAVRIERIRRDDERVLLIIAGII